MLQASSKMHGRFSFCDVKLMSNLQVDFGNVRTPDDIDTRPVWEQMLNESMPKQKRRRDYLPLAKCNHKSQIPKSMEEILKPCREQPFDCITCTATFQTLGALNRHEVDAKHVSRLCPSWVCCFCTKQEPTRRSMKNHLIEHHKCDGCKLFVHSR